MYGDPGLIKTDEKVLDQTIKWSQMTTPCRWRKGRSIQVGSAETLLHGTSGVKRDLQILKRTVRLTYNLKKGESVVGDNLE